MSSARGIKEGGAVEKPIPTNAREIYERSKNPDGWADDKPVAANARQLCEQSKHGGARPGSGRPTIDPAAKSKTVGFSLPPQLIDWIEQAAAEAEISKSAFVAGLLERSRRAALRRKGQ